MGEKRAKRRFHKTYVGLVKETKIEYESKEKEENEIMKKERRKSKKEYDDNYII
jgi:DNA repair exonuclease SbcCD nuclease subunit